jgi:ribosome-associated toxin RatA of RatAB toxin-antitoxin module
MPHVQATSRIEATPEEVFDFLAEYRNIPRLQPQFDSARLVSEQDRGAGAVVELKGRFHGMPISVMSRIITFSPPYRMVSISEGSVLSRNTWELHSNEHVSPTVTQVTFTVEYKMSGPLGGLFTGIASSIFHKEIQSMTDESLHRLSSIFAPAEDK